ncbi:hypothetical protein TNCV_3195321 [Trichonephila clavipes]|uniref:Uncharacterized protein n=1 Tax=Trichonephila clavipes TaxID=2585209 RepID=A0A8X6REG8_TRICX|nr:hypothetical protein TNCV_3195321 [Trichonephila clavipes]
MCIAVIHYAECKLLNDIDVSGKVGKLSKTRRTFWTSAFCTAENIENVSAVVRENRLQATTGVKTKTTFLSHPPYSTDLAPETSDYFLTWHVTSKVIHYDLQVKLKVHRRLN